MAITIPLLYTANSGTTIINRDNLGNSYVEASITLNRGGWMLTRISSTLWVALTTV